jgi:hypothetical protein
MQNAHFCGGPAEAGQLLFPPASEGIAAPMFN